jgi:hypothetical protein
MPDRKAHPRSQGTGGAAERIAAALNTLDEVETKREQGKPATGKTTEKRKEPRTSTTDPTVRVMKIADGGFSAADRHRQHGQRGTASRTVGHSP